MTRCILSLLLTGVAVTGLSGCGKEPPVQVNHAEMQETPATVERIAVKSIDFDGDLYLKDVCRDTLSELPFKRFTSYDFIYNSPFPVKVSGAYYEVRARGAADAATIYEEIKATIFRDVEIVVEAKQTAPYYSFDSWRMPFAVSDHPFSASRQLQHQRAMGSTFPFLDLAEIPFHNSFESRQPEFQPQFYLCIELSRNPR